MSYLDPSLARAELSIRSTPLPEVLDRVVGAFLTSAPSAPPYGEAQRAMERVLAGQAG